MLGQALGVFPAGDVMGKAARARTHLASALLPFGITDLDGKGKTIKIRGENHDGVLKTLQVGKDSMRDPKKAQSTFWALEMPVSLGSSYTDLYRSLDSWSCQLRSYAPDIYIKPRIQSESSPHPKPRLHYSQEIEL